MKTIAKTLVIVTLLGISSTLIAQNDAAGSAALMQLGKLTGSDATTGSQFGTKVAADGNTAVMSGGYVFIKPASGWSDATETARLAPLNGTAALRAFAVSGNTIVASAIETTQVGDVYVFVRPTGGWSGTVHETAILSDSSQFCFGATIATSGNTIVVGIGSSGGFTTGNCVFVRPSGGWKSVTHVTATLNVVFNGSSNAAPAAISGDTIVVGAPGNFDAEGALYVFVKPNTGWSGSLSPNAILLDSKAKLGDFLGGSVAISGNTIIASAAGPQSTGQVCIYVQPASGWTDMTETAVLKAPPNAIAFDYAVAIAGNTVVVAAPYTTVGFHPLQGAAFVYLKPQTGWVTTSKYNAEISSSDGASSDFFGGSVAAGGGNIFVSAPYAAVGSTMSEGAAYVFGK